MRVLVLYTTVDRVRLRDYASAASASSPPPHPYPLLVADERRVRVDGLRVHRAAILRLRSPHQMRCVALRCSADEELAHRSAERVI